jgi:hypothetical protein
MIKTIAVLFNRFIGLSPFLLCGTVSPGRPNNTRTK